MMWRTTDSPSLTIIGNVGNDKRDGDYFMIWPVIMHATCCEQGQTIDEMCANCSKWGFDGIEFRRKRSGVNESIDVVSLQEKFPEAQERDI